MGGKPKLDYSKVDPWIKKYPNGNFKGFLQDNPKLSISDWTFRKRKAKVLNLPLAPSMQDDYRGPTSSDGGAVDRRSRSVYTTVYTTSIQELKKKNGVEAVSDFIGILNRSFKLHLESAQIEVIGSGVQSFEIRRYSR